MCFTIVETNDASFPYKFITHSLKTRHPLPTPSLRPNLSHTSSHPPLPPTLPIPPSLHPSHQVYALRHKSILELRERNLNRLHVEGTSRPGATIVMSYPFLPRS